MNEKFTNKPLIILTGPTAVGKTKLSISLAKAVDGEIISADSMQVYKYMDIGTAKIKPEEMQGIRHYLIDIFDPKDDFNVVKFQELAKKAIEEIYLKNKIPIITGGTGFYIQSVLYDIDFQEEDKEVSNNNLTIPGNEEYRTYLENIAKEQGATVLHDMLKKIDYPSSLAIHENNIKRVIRALEYHKKTGGLISEHNEKERKKSSPYQSAYFVLKNDRQTLYDGINRRVDIMLSEGLVQEVEFLKSNGYSRNLISMQGLGYKEIYAYLEGEISLEEAVTILKRDTRHFAKRQLTWFRREKDVIWIDKAKYESEEYILEDMICQLKNRMILQFVK